MGYEDFLILPQATKHSDPSWFGFPIMVREDAPFTRRDIVTYLEENKIATRMLFGGNLLKQPAYSDIPYRIAGSLENTDRVMNDLFWIGVYPGIGEEQNAYILKVFQEFFQQYA
jgi:CDP-6-deoxy-D-xylo-4-hexulose-3-dehydrase